MFEDDDIMLDYYEGKKAHRRFNNLAPLLEEKGLDPQLALDANYVPSGQPKEYDDQFLQNDKNFQAVGRVMYNMDVNANNKKTRYKRCRKKYSTNRFRLWKLCTRSTRMV